MSMMPASVPENVIVAASGSITTSAKRTSRSGSFGPVYDGRKSPTVSTTGDAASGDAARVAAIASERMAATAESGTIRGVSKPSGEGNIASKVTKPTATARPMPPLNAVRKAPSMKNWVRILRWVAPRALRNPIYRVRSATDTSMMLTMPIAPRPSVTNPTTPRK